MSRHILSSTYPLATEKIRLPFEPREFDLSFFSDCIGLLFLGILLNYEQFIVKFNSCFEGSGIEFAWRF